MGDGQEGNGEPVALRWLAAFGRFWWEFLIGDTPELFVGVVAVIGLLAVLCLHPGLRTAAALVAPVLVAGVLTASVWRAARRRSP
jgi:hypothetical protein